MREPPGLKPARAGSQENMGHYGALGKKSSPPRQQHDARPAPRPAERSPRGRKRRSLRESGPAGAGAARRGLSRAASHP